jgi:hypothetical protein
LIECVMNILHISVANLGWTVDVERRDCGTEPAPTGQTYISRATRHRIGTPASSKNSQITH